MDKLENLLSAWIWNSPNTRDYAFTRLCPGPYRGHKPWLSNFVALKDPRGFLCIIQSPKFCPSPPPPPPKKSNLSCLSLTFTSSKNEKSVQKGILSTTFSSVSPLPLINPSLRFHDKAKTWFGHCLPIGYQLPVLPCYTFKSNFISLSNAVFNSKSQDLREKNCSFYYFRVKLSLILIYRW